MSAPRKLGIDADTLRTKPYAAYWNPKMAPLPPHIREAVAQGAIAGPLIPPMTEAKRLLDSGYQEVENGLTLHDGSLHIALVTEMPEVTPAMWDWWFGWHSAEPERYKLWHPRAHVHAEWRSPDPPGAIGRARYVGRTSYVDEYVGSRLGSYAIRFVEPKELGLDGPSIADGTGDTAICARVGYADIGFEMGYLLHHVRAVPGGSEMRSRFWIGGKYAGGRNGNPAGNIAARAATAFLKPHVQDGLDLLVHCSQEMSHLASFLPRLHAEFRDVQ